MEIYFFNFASCEMLRQYTMYSGGQKIPWKIITCAYEKKNEMPKIG